MNSLDSNMDLRVYFLMVKAAFVFLGLLCKLTTKTGPVGRVCISASAVKKKVKATLVFVPTLPTSR